MEDPKPISEQSKSNPTQPPPSSLLSTTLHRPFPPSSSSSISPPLTSRKDREEVTSNFRSGSTARTKGGKSSRVKSRRNARPNEPSTRLTRVGSSRPVYRERKETSQRTRRVVRAGREARKKTTHLAPNSNPSKCSTNTPNNRLSVSLIQPDPSRPEDEAVPGELSSRDAFE